MKKTVKKIQPILLLSIFLLFNLLSIISQVQESDILSNNEDSVSCCYVNLTSVGFQSLFNKEMSEDFEKDYIISTQQTQSFRPDSFNIKLVEIKSIEPFQQFVFMFQSDLPPPV